MGFHRERAAAGLRPTGLKDVFHNVTRCVTHRGHYAELQDVLHTEDIMQSYKMQYLQFYKNV